MATASAHKANTRDLLLIGGGHTHALVLRMWGMAPIPGVRLTLVNPGPTAPYSGMLPGFVAGHYPRSALDMDLEQLAAFAGARLVQGSVQSIDPATACAHVPGQPPLRFDVASIDVGITSAMPELPGFAEHGIPAKPLGGFAQRWQSYCAASQDPARIAVIGGGIAGVELILAMHHALTNANRRVEAHLLDRSDILDSVSARSRRKLRQALAAARITLHEGADIDALEASMIRLSDGQTIHAEFITGAAGARPYSWLGASGLACTDGYVTVGPTLQSSAPDVFAVGDCAHMQHAPRPKAGVFAVRQAPVLYHNLRARLLGQTLRSYHPQRDYLKLVSLGKKSALADKFGVAVAGPLLWRLKDRIDRRFMRQFEAPATPTRRPPQERDN